MFGCLRVSVGMKSRFGFSGVRELVDVGFRR